MGRRATSSSTRIIPADGLDADSCRADGFNADSCAAEGVSAEATVQGTSTRPDRAEVDGTDGLLGYDSEEALFAHAEAIRDTRVALTVVGGEIKYEA